MSGISNQVLIQEFYPKFQATRVELATRLEALQTSDVPPNILDDLAIDLAKIRKSLVDANAFLPSYDQRQCELHLKNLETIFETLRASSVPKSKFSFKRKSKPSAPAASSPQATTAVPTLVGHNAPQPHSSYGSAHLSLRDYSHRYLSLSSLSCPPSISSDLTISDLDHCIVDLVSFDENAGQVLSPPMITALHARNINNTILILPIIKGSALLHDLKHCIVAVGCHQFRMHASSHVDVYLSILSNPIIEHCTNIRFSAYPATFRPLSGVDARSEPESKHFAVQDFSHIRATPSPNWSALPMDESFSTWPQIDSGTKDASINVVLSKFLERLQ